MDYKSIIESSYNRKNWQELLHDIFGNRIQFWASPQKVQANETAKCAYYLAKIELADGKQIAVYEVQLSDSIVIERNKVGIRNLLVQHWKNNGFAGAFMFCYKDGESVLRFSYVSEILAFNENGKLGTQATDTKRYTYYLGEGHRSRTAIDQFTKLKGSEKTLEDVTKAFSIEAVSDAFFAGYKNIYEDIVEYMTGKRMSKVDGKWKEVTINNGNPAIIKEFSTFDNPLKAMRDYAKKLMGRLVFLQFIQKKGWLGVKKDADWGTGDKEYMQNLFATSKLKDDFIDKVLEPLFNDINTQRKDDLVSDKNVGTDIKIPFLNGGLFERDLEDETTIKLPAKYFERLFDFFSQYNFTIDENDPYDTEVGVDPEMLGRIFENLLEDNKDKGAFYTPKEIVRYMCAESLIAYLQTDIADDIDKDNIRNFIATHEISYLNETLIPIVKQKLKDVKICDPAIGSGAFPIGLLNELFACVEALEGEQANRAEIKKHIIQNNIYGVDIEKGAVDIARLRFWLSLVVDEDKPDALPNLDFKIMQGNSLLEQYNGVDLSQLITGKKVNMQMNIFDSNLNQYRSNLNSLIKDYFNTKEHAQKLKLKKQIQENVNNQMKEADIDIDFNALGIDVAGNDQFFLWHTWFADVFNRPNKNNGFDIVIGNPPYIDSESMTNQGLSDVRRILQQQFCNLKGNWDIYMAFFELALYLGDVVIFITPDKWISKPFGECFREHQLCNRVNLITRAGSKVFANATVDAIISLFLKKSKILHTAHFVNSDKVESISSMRLAALKKPFLIDFLFSKNSSIIQKIDAINTHIIDWVECENACATSDFYIVKDLIEENSHPDTNSYYKLINTGTIEKYRNKWFDKQISYGGKYSYPTIPIEVFNNTLGKSYVKRASQSKIIFKGLNLLDGCLDENAEIVPGKSTLVLCSKDIKLLKFLLGLLNSKLPIFYIKTKYASSSYCGGISFSKDMINLLPLEFNPIQQHNMVTLVDEILSIKKSAPQADTSALEHEIDLLVYDLYGLTPDEIAIVEGTNN